MDFLIRIPFLFLLAGLSAYLYMDGYSPFLKDQDYKRLQIEETSTIHSAGTDKNYANMVAIQPYLIPADYSTKTRFFTKMESYLQRAKSNGFLKERTTVIFPEHIGTPLYLLGEKKEIYTVKTLSELKNVLQIEYSKDSTTELINEILNKKAGSTRDIYQSTFSELAKIYKVNILAGTILLPESRLNDGKIDFLRDSQDRKITAYLFSSAGNITQKIERKNLFEIEKPFAISGNPPQEGIVVPGITNKLAVILSYDTFSPLSYTKIIQVTDFWVSPSVKFSSEIPDFRDPLYSGELNSPSKSAFKETDANLNPRDQWLKFGIHGRHSSTSSRSYIQIFLNGDFYDLSLSSWSSFQAKSASKQGFIEPDKHTSIINIFL